MEKKVALLLLALMLFASMLLISAEETPTIGQRLDTAAADVTKFFNEHAGPAVDSVSSSFRSVYNWVGDKAKEMGL